MRFLRSLAAVSLLVGWFGFSLPATASTPPPSTGAACQCWCTSKNGATTEATYAGSGACAAACKAKGEKIVVCSTKPSELPANNLRCFADEASCKTNCQTSSLPGENADGFIFDEGYQPPECPTKFRYCYCTGETYQLAYKIPNPDPSKPPIGEVADIGSYVNIVYKYLLGISGTVAIVMIMIGGIQYVTAVATGSVSAAKDRIKHAIIGLVLLFCAALILQTVNPRLLTLQPPRLPALRRIEMITGDADCAVLKTKGYTLAGQATNGTACGSKDQVLKDKSGTAVSEGTVCTYTTCSGSASCVIQGDKAECLTCKDIHPDNGGNPSSSLCAKAKPPESGNTVTQCGYSHDPGVVLNDLRYGPAALGISLLGTNMNALIGHVNEAGPEAKMLKGTCAEVVIDCSRINACEDYDEQKAEGGGSSQELNDLYTDATINPDISLQRTCLNDPCKKVRNRKSTCKYDAVENECISTSTESGNGCSANSQCQSNLCRNGICVNGTTGSTCQISEDCQSAYYCLNAPIGQRVCTLKKGGGGVCDANEQCQSGSCAGNVFGLTDGNCTEPNP